MNRLFTYLRVGIAFAGLLAYAAAFHVAGIRRFREVLAEGTESVKQWTARMELTLQATAVLGITWKTSPPPVEWRMRSGANVNFRGYTVCDRTYPGRFVLMSRDGRALWNERSHPVAPPAPGLVPKQRPAGWVWGLP